MNTPNERWIQNEKKKKNMLFLLILGLLLQNGRTVDTNDTEILEALQLFRKILNKDKIKEITVVPPLSKPDILSYIHNLNTDLLNRPGNVKDNNLSLLVNSREKIKTTSKEDDHNEKDKDENVEKVIKNKLDKEEDRRFVDWFRNLFGMNKNDQFTSLIHTEKKEGNSNSTKIAERISNTTKLTTIKETTTTKKLTTTSKTDTTKELTTTTKKPTTTTKKATTTTKKTTSTSNKKHDSDFEHYDENEQGTDNKDGVTDYRSVTSLLSADINDAADMQHSRKFMNWFKKLFGVGSTTSTLKPKTAPMSVGVRTEYENLDSVELKETNNDNNLTIILNKLNTVLEKLNDNLEKRKTKPNVTTGFLVLRVPVKSQIRQEITNSRRKREVNNDTTEIVQEETSSNVSIDTGTRKMMNFIPITNINDEANNHFGRPIENVNSNNRFGGVLKEKLIKIIAESFKDIKQKIEPLKTLKDKYSGDDLYVVGYVMASIDTLEVNLTKLIDEMELRKHMWDETKLLEIFERLNTSSSVISKLMNSLKKYTDIRQ